jgi:hypothetical protein
MMETHPGKKMATKDKKQQTNMNPNEKTNKQTEKPLNKRQPNR